jgi:hypothetical protein
MSRAWNEGYQINNDYRTADRVARDLEQLGFEDFAWALRGGDGWKPDRTAQKGWVVGQILKPSGFEQQAVVPAATAKLRASAVRIARRCDVDLSEALAIALEPRIGPVARFPRVTHAQWREFVRTGAISEDLFGALEQTHTPLAARFRQQLRVARLKHPDLRALLSTRRRSGLFAAGGALGLSLLDRPSGGQELTALQKRIDSAVSESMTSLADVAAAELGVVGIALFALADFPRG